MTIEEKVKQLIADHGFEYTDPKQTFEDMGMDSLDKVEVIMSLEEEFGIVEIDSAESDKLRCPADSVEYVRQHGKVSA